jgi:hypothetical protein
LQRVFKLALETSQLVPSSQLLQAQQCRDTVRLSSLEVSGALVALSAGDSRLGRSRGKTPTMHMMLVRGIIIPMARAPRPLSYIKDCWRSSVFTYYEKALLNRLWGKADINYFSVGFGFVVEFRFVVGFWF